MIKKIVFLVIILCFIGGGFFYWWQENENVRELNKTLPEGIKVDKCLFTGDYRVINEIDDYKFKIPEEWQGVKEIEYIPEREVEEYQVASMGLEGINGHGKILSIDVYHIDQNIELKQWAEKLFSDFGLISLLEKDKIGNTSVIKTKEEEHLGGTYIYFFKNKLKVYVLNCSLEEFIQYIILNGEW